MHPAIYSALTDARETELRRARRHETSAQKPRVRVGVRIAMRARRLVTA